MPTRCPACGMMPGEEHPRAFTREEQMMAWAVELTRASTQPGELAAEVGSRLRVLHDAVQTLNDGPPRGEG
jgi:hypothetical protein